MIKTNDNGDVLIYRKIDIKMLKDSMLLLFIALLGALIWLLITRSLFILPFVIIPALFLIICFIIYNKAEGEKLVFSLTKEGFTIFSKKNKFYKLNDIINFISIDDNGNYACINYYDENKNKKSKMFLVYGCSNNEFANLANVYLKENSNNTFNIPNEPRINYNNTFNISNEPRINSNDYKFIDNTWQLYKEIKQNSYPLRFTLIGKTTMFRLNGNFYNMQNLHTSMVFINEKCELLMIPLMSLVIDWEDLILDGVYDISYNKKKNKFYASRIPNEKGVDQTIINSLKNNIVFRAKILFDKQMIINEIKTYNKIMKSSKIIGIIIVCLFLLLFIPKYMAKKYNISYIDYNYLFDPIMLLITLLIFIVFPLNLLINITKLRKDNNLNIKKE